MLVQIDCKMHHFVFFGRSVDLLAYDILSFFRARSKNQRAG